jgi:hypothetical protein
MIMGAPEQKAKSQAQAAYMKERGITRTTGRCCLCNSIISIPTDKHFFGAVCGGPRKAVRR